MTRRVALSTAVLVLGLASVGRAQVKLEYKFEEGSSAKYRSTTKTHQILTISGTDVETKADEVTTTTYSVGKRNPDGKLPIQVKLESFQSQLSLPGSITVSYDSENPAAAKNDNPQLQVLYDVYKVMTGLTYTAVLDKDNKVAAVEGTDKTLEKANEINPMVADLLKGRLEADKLKHDFEQRIASFPDILVRPGDTWDKTEVMELGGGQSLTFKKRYEYEGTVEQGGATLDKIKVKSQSVTFALDPNSNLPAKVNNSDLKVESSEGTLLFDRKAGVAVERKGVNRIKGDMTLSINGMDLPSKLDLTLDVETKLVKDSK
jgi:hypothetical protein